MRSSIQLNGLIFDLTLWRHKLHFIPSVSSCRPQDAATVEGLNERGELRKILKPYQVTSQIALSQRG